VHVLEEDRRSWKIPAYDARFYLQQRTLPYSDHPFRGRCASSGRPGFQMVDFNSK
jgi:hypothetical protein